MINIIRVLETHPSMTIIKDKRRFAARSSDYSYRLATIGPVLKLAELVEGAQVRPSPALDRRACFLRPNPGSGSFHLPHFQPLPPPLGSRLSAQCRLSTKQFYYSVALGRCETFDYRGCQGEGNGNRFQTYEASFPFRLVGSLQCLC